MNKEHLLPALCKALGIEYHKHPHHEAVGIDKAKLKARMHAAEGEKEKAIEAGRPREAQGPAPRVPPPQPEDPGGDGLDPSRPRSARGREGSIWSVSEPSVRAAVSGSGIARPTHAFRPGMTGERHHSGSVHRQWA